MTFRASRRKPDRANEKKGGKRKAEQACRPDSVHRAQPGGQSFLWARHCCRALAIYPHAWTSRPWAQSAGACLFDVAPDRGCRVSPCGAAAGFPASAVRRWPYRCAHGAPAPQTRLCGPVPRLDGAMRRLAGRPLAAIPLCGVRTFLDASAPRLPGLPRHRYCNLRQ